MAILIDEQTSFIIQGITGREAVTMTRELLDYGSQVVGGVTPGRKGRDVHGVPVEDTVRAFTEEMRVDGSIVAVPPAFATDAVMEAIEAGYDPAEAIAIFRIPGSWEEEGIKILERYGVEWVDRSVSMHEAARRAVAKIQGPAAA